MCASHAFHAAVLIVHLQVRSPARDFARLLPRERGAFIYATRSQM